MNEDRNQGREPKQQAQQKHPDEWQGDLNPDRLAGQNIGNVEAGAEGGLTAFHLRKRGALPEDLGRSRLADTDLKRVPVLADGARLQQGATYVNLAEAQPREFTATGEMAAAPGDAIAPKDRVPYDVWNVWNRLIGEPKPGQ